MTLRIGGDPETHQIWQRPLEFLCNMCGVVETAVKGQFPYSVWKEKLRVLGWREFTHKDHFDILHKCPECAVSHARVGRAL